MFLLTAIGLESNARTGAKRSMQYLLVATKPLNENELT